MPKIVLNLDELTDERQRLSEFLATPNAYSDPQFSTKNKRFSELESLIKIARQRERLIKNIEEAKQLTSDSGELAELAKQELAESQSKLAKLEDEIFIMLTPKDPNDDKNIIMEIRAGAGGDEASLFASELYR
ncbi:MAG: PCRF domain-containing protein, partial [Candidatus Saccharibacteria bacterium]|nr:PCRF domain-containing protein [Candidatus Saccharibacteria bacterium]